MLQLDDQTWLIGQILKDWDYFEDEDKTRAVRIISAISPNWSNHMEKFSITPDMYTPYL